MRLGSSSKCKHTVLFGNSLLVLPCCSLPARSLRSLHHSTTAMGRRGLAELISIGKQKRCAIALCSKVRLTKVRLYEALHSCLCIYAMLAALNSVAYHICRDPGRELLKPGQLSPMLEVPEHIQRPPYVGTGENPWIETIQVHTKEVGLWWNGHLTMLSQSTSMAT